MAAKRRRTNKAAVSEEFQLPEAVIQHIQSYLDGKQAAQTTVLSKLWYKAWLTRPTLDFDQRNFQNIAKFVSFIKKTMKRYEDLSLKFESFRLFMEKTGCNSVSLANKLICKAVKMGAIDFNLRFDSQIFVLPKEVLEAESLVRLCVKGCKIDPLVERKVLCLGLRSLRLESVYAEEDTIRDIISSCRLIEDLQLSSCLCLFKVQRIRDETMLICRVPRLEYENHNVGTVVDIRRKMLEFCKLKSLLLEWMNLDSSFFHDFSLKFPCLEDMTLRYCDCYKGIQISNHSLKFINLESPTWMSWAEFDFPRIRKFTYSGVHIPSVSFRSVSSQWESDISIYTMGYYLQTTWFLHLKRFLLKLSPSMVSLSLPRFIGLHMENHIDYVKGVELLPKPVVEKLTLSMDLPSIEHPALLDGLFLCFHPKIITLKWSSATLLDYKCLEIFQKLIQQVCTSFCIPDQNLCSFRALEEVVEVEYTDKTHRWWWCMPWKTWLDTPPSSVYRYETRLKITLQAA